MKQEIIKIEIDQVRDTIKSIDNGKIFSVTFIKKDGTERVMNTMNGTSRGVKGVGLSFDPEPKGLIPVYDLQIAKKEENKSKCWRMVNVNTVKSIKAEGVEYLVI